MPIYLLYLRQFNWFVLITSYNTINSVRLITTMLLVMILINHHVPPLFIVIGFIISYYGSFIMGIHLSVDEKIIKD